jgi:hypothetical protein
MSMLADAVKPVGPSLAQIEAWVDILDRAEPEHSGWRTAFASLREQLTKARRIRDIVRRPIVASFTIASAVQVGHSWLSGGSTFLTWSFWLNTAALTLMIMLLVWEAAVLPRAFPVLELEGRVAALLRYYGAKDVPQNDEVFSGAA